MAEPKTTNPAAVVDDPIKVVEETSEVAKYAATAEDSDFTHGDATNGRSWLSEFRKEDGAGNNTVGVIRAFDGKDFTYDVAGLGEYSIEKNRAVAIAKAEKHFKDSRHVAQHNFDNDATASDGNRA